MNPIIEVLLELLKITVPALIVFFTVYVLMKQYQEGLRAERSHETLQKQRKTTLPLRLTAYERLSLFCERISIPAMVMRVKTPNMQAAAMRLALMMAVQQEFEHNITQQVYVSDQLWQIIKLSKDDILNMINLVGDSVDPQASADELVNALFAALEERESIPLNTALAAIKKEATLLLA